MKITFLGAARTVTGSCHLVEANGHKLLLDCGLFQGKRKKSFERNRNFPFSPAEADAVVLSHAHIDHSGNLPTLVSRGFRGSIWSTLATADLCDWMLRDSAHIQEKDVEYVNEKRKRRGQRPFEPLYRMEDAEKALSRFRGLQYGEEKEILPGVRLVYRDAGHILGSASCELRIAEPGGERTLVFTGDIGRRDRPILRDPVPPETADVLITESTYGNRIHEGGDDVRQALRRVIAETAARGGKVLIPAFSVGRTQRLVYDFHQLFLAGELAPIPIFVDSPLSSHVTGVFRQRRECYDEEIARFATGHRDPFGFSRLTFIEDVAASKALNAMDAPCVVIAASGMCEAGRVLHHLKRVVPDRRSTILTVGFMAAHTLGRRIQEHARSVKIFGDEYPLRARVETVHGLSAHADRNEILAFLGELERPPEKTFVVHGEPEPAEALAEALRERAFPDVLVPEAEQSVEC